MDDLTKSILETLDDQEKHPELYQIILVCDKCKRRKVQIFPKEEVAKYRANHKGSNELHQWQCEKCTPEEKEDE